MLYHQSYIGPLNRQSTFWEDRFCFLKSSVPPTVPELRWHYERYFSSSASRPWNPIQQRSECVATQTDYIYIYCVVVRIHWTMLSAPTYWQYWATKTSFCSTLLDASALSYAIEATFVAQPASAAPLPAGTTVNDGRFVRGRTCVWVCLLLLPGICLSDELPRLRIERTSVRLTWSQTLLLSPPGAHTHTRGRLNSGAINLSAVCECAGVCVSASVCEFRGAGLRQRVRAYDSSVSGAAASQARFILFRNMLADCSVAPSLNRCEARPTHSRRRTRGGRRIPIYKIDDFHFLALNGFYNVASESHLFSAPVHASVPHRCAPACL